MVFSAQVKDTSGNLVGVWANFADFSLVEEIIGESRDSMISSCMAEPDLMLLDRAGVKLVDYDPLNLDATGKLTHDFDNLLKTNLASEVMQSAQRATSEISAQIESMQQITQTVIVSIREISGTINRVNEISSAIASAVQEQGAATSEIARNVQEASTGTAEVSSSIGTVQEAAAETGEAASQMQSAATELAAQSEKLKSQVEAFLAAIRSA
jgi:hypothetical protein